MTLIIKQIKPLLLLQIIADNFQSFRNVKTYVGDRVRSKSQNCREHQLLNKYEIIFCKN